MRLATVRLGDVESAAVIIQERAILIAEVNKYLNINHPESVFELLQPESFRILKKWWETADTDRLLEDLSHSVVDINFAPLYPHPRKIWGIGLNYVEHAEDLSEQAPSTEPASFMKPDTTIIGHGDTIEIPHQSERTTAEAELGIVIGKVCKNVSEEDAADVIAGFTPIIDMTAEDILQKNPRYLTRSKSFDTFFSFGPELVTPDEIEDLADLQVTTIINGSVHRFNRVRNMTFNPYHLVSFHSKVMTLLPGDIISTGTPGAVVIRDGDVVECQIDGFRRLSNPVADLKLIGGEKINGLATER